MTEFSQIGGRCNDQILGSSTVHCNFQQNFYKILNKSSFGQHKLNIAKLNTNNELIFGEFYIFIFIELHEAQNTT